MKSINEESLIQAMQSDNEVKDLRKRLLLKIAKYRYTYNFTWLGIPIIQLPDDLVAIQELIWRVKPQLIIETGIAHGGGVIFYASLLEMIGRDGIVLGIDIDIRPGNRVQIEGHPMFKRIKMIEGSSIDEKVIQSARDIARDKSPIMIVLDSNHTHEHVYQELMAYSPLVSKDSYMVVLDTVVEDMPDDLFSDRPWGKGNNPKTAAREFLKSTDRFEVDKEIENKLLITVAPEGYLKCIKD